MTGIDREEQARLIRQNGRRAITLAMEGHWQEAVEANRAILADFPTNTEALNRMGRAYLEMGDYEAAREAYQRTRKIDPFNSIAEKNLKRLASLTDGKGAKNQAPPPAEPRTFIEETGKAGVVRLTNLAARKELAKVVAGDRIALEATDGNLAARSEAGVLLGTLETRHGQRLARLMAGGNQYQASVISASDSAIALIVRETFQAPAQVGQLSFPSKGLEAAKPFTGDKLPRQRLEYEEEPAEGEPFGTGEEEGEEEAGPENEEEETEEEEG
jgi:tetratricopeptide (TPR) repeat protein